MRDRFQGLRCTLCCLGSVPVCSPRPSRMRALGIRTRLATLGLSADRLRTCRHCDISRQCPFRHVQELALRHPVFGDKRKEEIRAVFPGRRAEECFRRDVDSGSPFYQCSARRIRFSPASTCPSPRRQGSSRSLESRLAGRESRVAVTRSCASRLMGVRSLRIDL